MDTMFNVGIIGMGYAGSVHTPGWLASPYAHVVAGADLDAVALQRWGNAHGVKKLFADAHELIRDPDIDIIDVCTPNKSHTPLVVAALEAGKHVLCEKPLAVTPEEIRRMIEARNASGKELMTAQHYRFHGPSQAVKAEIDQGVLGEVYHARAWMLRRNAYVPSRTFVYKEHAGGGACIDIGVHILDLVLWLMGNPKPVTVSGVTRRELGKRDGVFSIWSPNAMPQDADVEEFAAAFVRFENGATLMLEVSWLLHHDAEVQDEQVWLYGTEGGCHWPSTQFLSSNYETKQSYNRTLKLTADGMEPHALECYEFAQALAEGRPSPVPPEASLQVMAILQGIYRSQDERREVSITV
jgi:predicted dehydrogenase